MRNQNSHPKGNQRPSSAAQEAPAGKLSREQEQAEAGSRPFKKRFIKREGRRRTEGKEGKGGRKPHKRTEERDLDRELRDYWLTQKGGKADEDLKQLAREKLNCEMENYWKQRKEQSDPKPS